MKRFLGLLLLGFSPALAFSQEHSPSATHWSYEGDTGPQRWGDLEPAYSACKTGKQQSPIDIHNPQRAALPQLSFDYHAVPLKVINNGHTIQINYAPGSFITVENVKYQLVQFHFHHPSEEKIDGQAYDMVAHLVHRDSAGHLAVVAVLLKGGPANSLVQSLWNHLPKEVGKENSVDNVKVNVADLLPAHTGYYAFEGSLTTPPCTEGIRWLVLNEPVTISPSEISTFSEMYRNNARPTQPLNGRIVKGTT